MNVDFDAFNSDILKENPLPYVVYAFPSGDPGWVNAVPDLNIDL